MTAPTIAVVGVGPGVGMSVARRFGREGFRVALVARNGQRLQQHAAELGSAGVEAVAFPTDVADRQQIVDTFARIGEELGPVDVLEWGPWSGGFDEVAAADTDETAAQAYFALKCLSTVTGVRQVLPAMMTRRAGTVLITTGGAATHPVPRLTPYAMAAAAERMYALQLHRELQDTLVHVGIVTIRARVGTGPVDADSVAEAHWLLHSRRDRAEIELS